MDKGDGFRYVSSTHALLQGNTSQGHLSNFPNTSLSTGDLEQYNDRDNASNRENLSRDGASREYLSRHGEGFLASADKPRSQNSLNSANSGSRSSLPYETLSPNKRNYSHPGTHPSPMHDGYPHDRHYNRDEYTPDEYDYPPRLGYGGSLKKNSSGEFHLHRGRGGLGQFSLSQSHSVPTQLHRLGTALTDHAHTLDSQDSASNNSPLGNPSSQASLNSSAQQQYKPAIPRTPSPSYDWQYEQYQQEGDTIGNANHRRYPMSNTTSAGNTISTAATAGAPNFSWGQYYAPNISGMNTMTYGGSGMADGPGAGMPPGCMIAGDMPSGGIPAPGMNTMPNGTSGMIMAQASGVARTPRQGTRQDGGSSGSTTTYGQGGGRGFSSTYYGSAVSRSMYPSLPVTSSSGSGSMNGRIQTGGREMNDHEQNMRDRGRNAQYQQQQFYAQPQHPNQNQQHINQRNFSQQYRNSPGFYRPSRGHGTSPADQQQLVGPNMVMVRAGADSKGAIDMNGEHFVPVIVNGQPKNGQPQGGITGIVGPNVEWQTNSATNAMHGGPPIRGATNVIHAGPNTSIGGRNSSANFNSDLRNFNNDPRSDSSRPWSKEENDNYDGNGMGNAMGSRRTKSSKNESKKSNTSTQGNSSSSSMPRKSDKNKNNSKGSSKGGKKASPLMEEFRKKNRKLRLSEIADHLKEFAFDQHGSRYIQQELDHAPEEETQAIFAAVVGETSVLTNDVFGNYIIQKLLQVGTPLQKKTLGEQLVGDVLELCFMLYGCRVVQKALENLQLEQQLLLTSELRGHVIPLVLDQNGNHVIQRCLERLPAEHLDFIIDSFRGQVIKMSTHCYGCRVIQRIIEYCTPQQSSVIYDEICSDSSPCKELIMDQYANYVIQYMLQHGRRKDVDFVINLCIRNMTELSNHKFASNIVEKVLERANEEQASQLLEAVLIIVVDKKGSEGSSAAEKPLHAIMKDKFGNYIIQKLLQMATSKLPASRSDIKHNFFLELKRQLPYLSKLPYGKHVLYALREKGYMDEKEVREALESNLFH